MTGPSFPPMSQTCAPITNHRKATMPNTVEDLTGWSSQEAVAIIVGPIVLVIALLLLATLGLSLIHI